MFCTTILIRNLVCFKDIPSLLFVQHFESLRKKVIRNFEAGHNSSKGPNSN